MKARRDYVTIARNLRKLDFFVDDSDVDKDVLRVGRPLPNSRSKGFWIGKVEGTWYVGTYLQIGYAIPNPDDIEAFCMECLYHLRFMNSFFPKTLIKKYALRMIVGNEYKKVIG